MEEAFKICTKIVSNKMYYSFICFTAVSSSSLFPKYLYSIIIESSKIMKSKIMLLG